MLPHGYTSRSEPLVATHGLVKRYGQVRALDGLSLTIPPGGIFGLLGEMTGRLYGLSRRDSKIRAAHVLEAIGLTAAADRQVKNYSGGMRRRIDLAASLAGRPQVLFLDEPTTGVDPTGRRDLWDLIAGLTHDGTTVVLTTQYLEEADELASRIAVINYGRVVDEGSPDDLKARTGGAVLELSINDDQREAALTALGESTGGPATFDTRRGKLVLPAGHGVDTLREALYLLHAVGIRPNDVGLRKPTLDDVFLHLTNKRKAWR